MIILLSLACSADTDIQLSAPSLTLSAPGITLTVRGWSRGGERGELILAEIAPDVPLSVRPSAAPTQLQQLLPEASEWVMINGGFYTNDQPMGLVVSEGIQRAPLQASGGSGVLDATGRRILHRSDVAPKTLTEAVQSIDRLVDAGAVLVSEEARTDKDARAAVAFRADGVALLAILYSEEAVASRSQDDHRLQLQLDRDSTSSGVSLREWAQLLVGQGATQALNLDGGFSTALSASLSGQQLEVLPHRATINAVSASR